MTTNTNQARLGSRQGFTGIPSLLLSDLQRVHDPVVQRALYQIQNFCNSVGNLPEGVTSGSGTATLGTSFPGFFTIPTFWTPLAYKGNTAYIPVWV